MQEEAVRVIGELSNTQGKVKQPSYGAKEKLTIWTTQGADENTKTEETILKEVEV
jgi:hypothetical protein